MAKLQEQRRSSARSAHATRRMRKESARGGAAALKETAAQLATLAASGHGLTPPRRSSPPPAASRRPTASRDRCSSSAAAARSHPTGSRPRHRRLRAGLQSRFPTADQERRVNAGAPWPTGSPIRTQSADLAFDRQSRLALPLRPGDSWTRPTISADGRPAVASGTARLAGRRVPRPRAVPERAAPPDRHQFRLPAIVEPTIPPRRRRSTAAIVSCGG